MFQMIRMDRDPITSDATTALRYLSAQINGLTTRTREPGAVGARAVASQAALIELLLLRGHLLGWIADHEQAGEVARRLVRSAPESDGALLSRARVHATLRRFPRAMADLDAAGRAGASQATLDAERSAVLRDVGCYAEARSLLQRAASSSGWTFGRLADHAALQAEQGDTDGAERAFEQARCAYRGHSPFPVAQMDVRRGAMWLRAGDLPSARRWFEAAWLRVPGYVHAAGFLAEVDLRLGDPAAAVARLAPVVETSDDPAHVTRFVLALQAAGQDEELDAWRERAGRRYSELVACHPEAYADRAADFWLTAGADVDRGLQLALQSLATQQTADAHALLQRAEALKTQQLTGSM